MKKKVFSLMMTLVLAFMGVARAEVVEIGDGGTTTNSYLPSYSLYNYSLTQQIYTAAEIGTAGTINSIAFYNGGTEKTRTYDLYLVNTTKTTFADNFDWIPVTAADLVFSGSVTMVPNEWTTFVLDTPFAYDGTSNLAVVMDDNTGSWSSGMACRVYSVNGLQALRVYSDPTNYDPSNPSNYSGTTMDVKNQIQLSITTNGGGSGSLDQLFALQNGVEVETINVGTRPNGAWMEPFTFQLRNDGQRVTVTNLDFTPDGFFGIVAPELPLVMNHNDVVDVTVNTGTTNLTEWQFVALYDTRTARIWTITAEPYNPQTPDVWEMACEEATNFPFVEVPATAHATTLHNDYTLPFPEIEEGYDAVYKLVFDNDMVLNAEVTAGANGKVALYAEDFNGEGGPMATNNYNGPMAGGGAAGAPFEAQIGEGTTTTGYFPFYTLYNYSIAENLYLATELAEAGVTTAPMTSLSWYATNAPGYAQQGITIWMANVEDTELTTTSHIVNNMTKVYTGAMTPEIGWNEFVFNEGTFAWDGHSNVLIFCQRNNGSWNSTVYWQATGSMPFTAMAYRYQDSGAYDPTVANTMYTSTTRPNVIMKAARGNRSGDIVLEEGFEDGTMPLNWHSEGDNVWVVGTGDYSTSTGAHTGSYNAMCTHSSNLNETYLVSPAMDLSGATEATLSFAYINRSWLGDIDEFGVYYRVNGGAWNELFYTTAAHSEWTENTIALTGLAANYELGFMMYDHYGYGVAIDDIVVEATNGGAQPAGEISYGPVITNAPVAAGTYYLVASSTDADFEVTINAEDMPCPQVEGFAFNPMPADNEDEIEPASVTLKWNNPANATEYQVVFGSTYYPQPNHPQTVISDWTPVTGATGSFTVRNLWNNNNYFWYVVFRNGGACQNGIESAHWGFTTHLNVPQNLTAVDETVFNDETIVLNWTAVVDRTYRKYNVYRDGELIGSTQVNNISNSTYTDGPLPYNMGGYTYYVTAVYDEGESAPSNTVNVKVSGRGNVDGHVYEQDGTTGIAGATVTMVGPDEFGVNHTYNFTTNAQGYYSGAVYAGSYNGQAAKDGYQTITAPVQGNPINITYNVTTSPVDYVLDENFDPVCSVVAEYYPDSLDPMSPYVKVYWGCGLPGEEIVEPFETGDFSMFDWQLDPTYPWSVTTTNPYEGQYCMKSGGAGVANVVSNMTVTVNIPADGEMSFFGKISSESNWDYGYFYIDGAQMGQYTGAGNWGERSFNITAGDHTFQWRYTKDGSVNSNDDCFYVDYITFYKRPEPAQPGWVYYDDGVNVDAIGLTAGGSFYWGVMFPAGSYAGNSLTKVSMYDYSAHTGTILVYQGGANTPGTLVGQQAYSCTGSEDFVEWTLNSAISVDPSQNLWIVMNNDNGQYVASACANTGDPNGRWISLDGATWEDVAGYGLDYTWMIRAYVAAGAKGAYYAPMGLSADVAPAKAPVRVKGEVNNVFSASGNATAHNVGVPAERGGNTRSLHHYNIYRTNCYNDGPYTAENTVLLATNWPGDTIYIDVEWQDLPAGVYKWGVGCVYAGNRGDLYEAPISWGAPANVSNRTAGELVAQNGVAAGDHTGNGGATNRDGWIMYDDGIYEDAIGLTAGGSFYWGISFPDVSELNGNQLTKVAYYDNEASTGNLMIYQGGTTAPGTLVYTQPYATSGVGDFVEFTLDSPVTIDGSQSLWIVMNNLSGQYVATLGAYCGDDNSQWISLDGSSWDGLYNTTGGSLDGTWMIRGYVQEGGGSNPGGNNLNWLAEPRESETIWSNCLDKGMYLGENEVDITVLLNSADSPEGVTVSFTNYNEAEQELYPMGSIVLDETGYYAWDQFRKGDYQVKIENEGYYAITDSVSIWDATSLRYVMTEIIYGISDLYVSRTGWAMWEGMGQPGGGGGGGQGGNGDTFSENFDAGMPAGWTTVDANNDGYNWVLGSQIGGVYLVSGASLAGSGHNASADLICSGSYSNATSQAINPDNYLVSPQVNLVAGSTFSFWACAQDSGYPAEHFGVAVSDNGTSDWTMVQEWTMTAKGSGDVMSIGRGGETRAQGNWYNYTVDLSAYAGQKYIAIRHFNCYDQFILDVDDIELTNGAKDGDRHLEYYKVMCESLDHEPIFNANTVNPFCQLATDELVEGEQYLCKVAAVYSTGMSDWVECIWQYESCENYAGTVNGIEVNGTTVSWEYPGGGVNPQPGQGDAFSVDFEAGLPAGWNVIDGNNDGWTWCTTNNIPNTWTYYAGMALDWYHNGTNAICSGSYINGVGALTPDEYLVSPQVTLAAGSTFSFYAAATDAGYPADHFGVFVSDNGTSDWTMVNEWTLTAKSGAKAGDLRASRDGNGNRLGNWYQYTVDLSNFAGQKYIAIRHFNCTDQYIMCVDDIELTSGAKSSRNAWDLMMTFTAPEAAHYGVAYDGNNFYTSNWGYSSAAHNFYKYDLQGNMLEGFEIPGCGTLRGITYDGQYFYGVANSATVYCVDLANHSVVSTFSSSYGAMRGITYDPVRDGFWVIGNWSGNLTLIDRTGAVQFVGPEPTSASDLAYYKDENDVEHVFCFNNGDNGVYDYNITTNTLGGSVFNFSNTPGYDPSSGSAGGCTVGSFNGKIAFIGDIQQSPNLIGIYELRDDTNPGPNPQPGESNILGAMLFLDGEWEAFVPYPTNEYTYEEGGRYCVRMVYDGTAVLPDNNFYYAMSCEECEGGEYVCEPGAPIHAELMEGNDDIKVWWGTEPAAPVSDWLYYDDGQNVDAIGLTNGGSFYWGIKFPAASMGAYAGCSVTKIAYYDYTAHTGSVMIYNGSNGNAPGTLIGTYSYNATGTENYVEWEIPAVAFDNTQDLWIVMNNNGGQYVASMGNYTGEPNGTMISTDGTTWYTLDDATGGAITGTWNLRCYVTNQAKGGEIVALDAKLNGTPGAEIGHSGVAKSGSFNLTMNNDRPSILKYNVYRSTEANGDYTMIGEVEEDGSGYYEYIDSPATAGTYYYQVRADYGDCESEPAQAADDPSVNYVSATTDGINELDGEVSLYPNPTNGNVTIEASGMNRITVVSVLGQVVYDTELSGDSYTMNMAQFNAGMYIVRVYTENGVAVKRVTVMQ